jgi:multiple sugar transport system permease protein
LYAGIVVRQNKDVLMQTSILRNPLRRREALWGYLMIAPMIVGLGVFFYFALGTSFFISLTDWDLLTAPIWQGFANYSELLSSETFRNTLWNTARFTLLNVPLGLLVSLLLALALNTKIRFRGLYRLIFFLPVMTRPVAISIVWQWIYNPDFGLLNAFLKIFGVERIRWLNDPNTAMTSLVIMSVWMGAGYGMVIILAGLQNIPRDYYEAAQVDGANGFQLFRKITLPLLTPTLFFNVITSSISSLQVFDIIYTLTKGGPLETTRSIVYNIYDDGFRFFRMGDATAAAWILFVIILVITIIQFRVQRYWVHYE